MKNKQYALCPYRSPLHFLFLALLALAIQDDLQRFVLVPGQCGCPAWLLALGIGAGGGAGFGAGASASFAHLPSAFVA